MASSVNPSSPTLSQSSSNSIELPTVSKTTKMVFGIFCLLAAGALFYGMNQTMHVWKQMPSSDSSRSNLLIGAFGAGIGGCVCTVMGLYALIKAYGQQDLEQEDLEPLENNLSSHSTENANYAASIRDETDDADTLSIPGSPPVGQQFQRLQANDD